MTNYELNDAGQHNTFSHSGTRMARDPSVWRYMDLLSLLSLLSNETLHFTNLRDLHRFDTNEGTGGLSINVVNDPIMLGGWSTDSTPEMEARNAAELARIQKGLSVPLAERITDLREQVAKWDTENANVYISCWHANELEADFMWRIYAKHEYGFAVVSNAQDLIRCFDGYDISKIGFGFVIYPTRDQLIREDLHSYMGIDSAFMVKHPKFAPENEFRVFVRPKEHAKNCDLKVNLKRLVKQIRISPLVPEWAESALLATLNPMCEKKGLPPIQPRGLKLR